MRVQRPLAVVLGLSVAGLVGAAVIASRDVAPGRVGGGLEVALPDGSRTHDGNIRALARDVFSDHVLAFELTSVLLVIAGLGLAASVSPGALAIAASYIVLNVAYSLGVKHVALLDVFVIAAGFMLRLLAGTQGLGIEPSRWLLLCGLMVTLFLGFERGFDLRHDGDEQFGVERQVGRLVEADMLAVKVGAEGAEVHDGLVVYGSTVREGGWWVKSDSMQEA